MKKYLTRDGIQHFSEHFEVDFLEYSKYIPPKRNTGAHQFIADPHLPFHHKKYLRKTWEDAEQIGVGDLWIIGDAMDNYSTSRFPKLTYKTFKDEFREAWLELRDLAIHYSKVKILWANHDSRLARFMFNNMPMELAALCHTHLLEELIELLPNVEIIEHKIGARNIGYLYQYKNILFSHIEKSSIVRGRVAQHIHESIQSKWKKLYGIKDYDCLMQAHNHIANIDWTDDTCLIQMPCLIDISQPAFDYVFNGKFAGNPPALGYLTGIEKNNYIDPTSIILKKFKGY